jgi:K+-sensing histidine kinase KdpD
MKLQPQPNKNRSSNRFHQQKSDVSPTIIIATIAITTPITVTPTTTTIIIIIVILIAIVIIIVIHLYLTPPVLLGLIQQLEYWFPSSKHT